MTGSTEEVLRVNGSCLCYAEFLDTTTALESQGYITPEIAGKFPGYLSPSAGLKFADVPNGLAAISKVPSVGHGLGQEIDQLFCSLATFFNFSHNQSTLSTLRMIFQQMALLQLLQSCVLGEGLSVGLFFIV